MGRVGVGGCREAVGGGWEVLWLAVPATVFTAADPATLEASPSLG